MAKKKYIEKRVYDVSAGKRYANIPKAVTDCPNYRKLSCEAKALLLDAASLLNGVNNGDISLTHTVLRDFGWNSKRKLFSARHELEHYGFINMSRQGGSHVATLYSLAWWNIHHCKGKLQVPSTNTPACTYLVEKPIYPKPNRKQSIQPDTVKVLRTGELSEREIKKSGSPLILKRFTPDTVVGDL